MQQVLSSMNSLVGALFLLSAVVMMTTRQTQNVLRLFVVQSVLLAASAFILIWVRHSAELIVVVLITITFKTVIIPLVLNRSLGREVRRRRELEFVVNTPVSLLIALGITALSYFFVEPLVGTSGTAVSENLAMGLDVLLIGVYTLTVRREAMPQILALMMIDNGAFYTGIAITRASALIELAAGLEGIMVIVVVVLLTRALVQQVGTTETGALTTLKEGESK